MRQQVLRAVDEGIPRAEIIERFQVSRATIKRYLKQRRETGNVLSRPIPGRPPRKQAALLMGVPALLEAHPEARKPRVLPMVGNGAWYAGQPQLDEPRDPHAWLGALPEEASCSEGAVKEEWLAVFQCIKQTLERIRRGLLGPRLPIASQHDPWLQPCAHHSQSSWPGHVRPPVFFCADFFSPCSCSQEGWLSRRGPPTPAVGVKLPS